MDIKNVAAALHTLVPHADISAMTFGGLSKDYIRVTICENGKRDGQANWKAIHEAAKLAFFAFPALKICKPERAVKDFGGCSGTEIRDSFVVCAK